MKDEIKEILEFKENADYKKISVDEIVILENCITNLQEENEKLKDKICRLEDRLINRRTKIDKVIEHIEESLNILEGDSDIPILTGNVRNRYLKPVLNILKGSDKE